MRTSPPPMNTPIDLYQSDGVRILGPVRLIPVNGDGSVKIECVRTGSYLPGAPVTFDPINGNQFILFDSRKRRLTTGTWSWENADVDPPYLQN